VIVVLHKEAMWDSLQQSDTHWTEVIQLHSAG